MNYLKFSQYAYIFAGILLAVDAVIKWKNDENYYFSAIVSLVCIFMFFFRRKFSKKFEDRNKKS